MRKAVVVAAPHTTNWDMPHMIAVAWALDVRPSWLGKKSLFRFPFGWMMRKLGGIPVDRSRRANVVDQAIERFAAADRLLLVIPPSGTRSRAAHSGSARDRRSLRSHRRSAPSPRDHFGSE